MGDDDEAVLREGMAAVLVVDLASELCVPGSTNVGSGSRPPDSAVPSSKQKFKESSE